MGENILSFADSSCSDVNILYDEKKKKKHRDKYHSDHVADLSQ